MLVLPYSLHSLQDGLNARFHDWMILKCYFASIGK